LAAAAIIDGDNLRNASLNARWVKAVIPIRPGKDKAASAWLQNVQVEGSDGLDAAYAAPAAELAKIRSGLGRPSTHTVTIEFLCMEVSAKHEESNQVKKYPDEEINDDNKGGTFTSTRFIEPSTTRPSRLR
jgi:hypothetical protein